LAIKALTINEDIESIGLIEEQWTLQRTEGIGYIYSYPSPPNGWHQELMVMMMID